MFKVGQCNSHLTTSYHQDQGLQVSILYVERCKGVPADNFMWTDRLTDEQTSLVIPAYPPLLRNEVFEIINLGKQYLSEVSKFRIMPEFRI